MHVLQYCGRGVGTVCSHGGWGVGYIGMVFDVDGFEKGVLPRAITQRYVRFVPRLDLSFQVA